MTTTTGVAGSTVDNFGGLGLGQVGATPGDSQAASSERFLKMLVAQMQNQDPLNPMDNAQVTSQMAQINTVSGLEQVNISVRSLNGQLLQMQALQGASLVGRDVTLAGDRLAVEGGVGRGGFDIAGKASDVRVDVVNSRGNVVDTLKLGAQEAGRHFFEWKAGSTTDTAGMTFRVTSTNAGKAVENQSLMRDRVNAVSTDGSELALVLQRAGTVPSNKILAFN